MSTIEKAPRPVTISFSEKNKDVAKLLKDLKKDLGRAFNQNDYVCQCIRFFEENKDKSFSKLNENRINELIENKLEEFKKQLINEEIILDIDGNLKKQEFNNEVLEEVSNIDASSYEED